MASPDTNIFGLQLPGAHDIGSQIDQALSPTATELQFPEDRPKYYCTLDFSTYAFRTATGSGSASERLGTVILPMPVQLLDKHNVAYDEKSLVGATIKGIIQAAATTGPATILSAFQGLTPNYYQTVMFDRPVFKRLELQFKLAPRNFSEAQDIRDIITYLNNRMAPGISGLGATSAAVLFTFPDVVKVILRPNSGFLYKFKPAVIEQLAVNYNGGGNQKAFYHNPSGGGGMTGQNPPESVELTLNLIEVEYWKTGDFTNDNDSTGAEPPGQAPAGGVVVPTPDRRR